MAQFRLIHIIKGLWVLNNALFYSSRLLFNYTGLQGFVVEKLWVVSGVIFDVESESGIRIILSRQDCEIFEDMRSKNRVFRYF